jgi:NTP pyrophosphatase (non-canonical NTP hydrolase)
MEINEFARMSFERNKNNDPDNIFDWEFHLIGMSGECGELLNKLKKIKRGDFPLNKEEIAEEVADVITYAFLLLSELGVDPEQVIMNKYEKVNQRLAEGGWHIRN